MRVSSVAAVVICTLLGIGWGAALGGRGHLSLEPTPTLIPAPHNVPKMAGGTALRMAMVHDVVHQRYFLHSPAYYNQRTLDCRKKLGPKFDNIAEAPDDLRPTFAEYALLEDLAVGLERTKQYPEAIAIQRKKLVWQADLEKAWLAEKEKLAGKPAALPLSPEHAALYGTYVNLGTFLMLDSLGPAIGGDPKGKAQLKESIEWVKKAIEINPDSHFGREIWQVVIGEHLLAAVDNPLLLTKYDMCGNGLDEVVAPGRGGELRMPFHTGWVEYYLSKPHGPSAVPWDSWAENDREEREKFRKAWITAVGSRYEWTEAVPGVPKEPAPFDEPTLAILGMWMLGGGPNPHFSLALGETMARVGEPELAWKAFARTRKMSGGFWSDPKICEAIDKHCQKRQSELVSEVAFERLEREFNDSLAKGEAYQKAQAEFEARRIAEGVALDDPQFYAPFFSQQGRISSKLGVADMVKTPEWRFTPLRILPAICFYGGVGSVLGMLIVWMGSKKGGNAAAPAR